MPARLLLVPLLLLFAGGCGFSSNDLLAKGTKVENLDLSGLSLAEAKGKIEEWAKAELEERRVLVYNDTEISITLQDLGLALDRQKALDDLACNSGKKLSGVLKADSAKLSPELQANLQKLSVPPKDASYKLENDQFVVIPAVSGRMVDLNRLVGDLQEVPLPDIPNQIDIPMADVPAAVTAEAVQAMAFDGVIGEYSTSYAVYEENRTVNLTKAALALDRKVVLPGEAFSFNAAVGPRDSETGYKKAAVIRNGEYVQETGGGVCQVSSTLYNAILLSNLPIVEREPHGITVSYVPPGQDATVNYPDTDFKFKNDTANLIYLRAEAASGNLTFRIWGKKTDKTVRLERQVENETVFSTERRLDPKLAPGRVVQEQAGSKGITVSTWKIVRDGSGNETKQLLSRDVYAPTNRILRVGRSNF